MPTRQRHPEASRVFLQVSHRAGRAHARTLEALSLRFLDALRLEGVELSLSLVDDKAIRALNREWRGKDKPTDVLSFPAGDLPPGTPVLRPLGDVILSLDTARRQAKEHGRSLDDELALYLAHGLLHLLGHDHHTPREAKAMARLEDALLGREGMVRASGVVRAVTKRSAPGPVAAKRKAPGRRTAARRAPKPPTTKRRATTKRGATRR